MDYIQITEMVYRAWTHYLTEGIGFSEGETFTNDGVRPIVRQVTVRVDAEVFPREALHCGVRALSRSDRSFTLEQALWRDADDRLLALCSVVLVTFDPSSGRPTAVPAHLWDAVEGFEGRKIGRVIPASD